MTGFFEDRYPNIAGWLKDGWIEICRDDYSRSFARVLDVGGLAWEGEECCEIVDEALSGAEAAIAAWRD